MENEVKVGMNRTGLQMAAEAKDELVSYAQQQAANGPEPDGAFDAVHIAYIEEAERLGSVPVPATVKGMAATVA
jgi:hypothetical protein